MITENGNMVIANTFFGRIVSFFSSIPFITCVSHWYSETINWLGLIPTLFLIHLRFHIMSHTSRAAMLVGFTIKTGMITNGNSRMSGTALVVLNLFYGTSDHMIETILQLAQGH